MIRFGMWSTLLAVGSLHGLVTAVMLCRATHNVAANRFLAALLVVVVAYMTPYTIGYAGFYDAWPGLTFAPFFWQLGIGPLMYLHVRQLGADALPRRWGWHLAPMALQGAYYLALCGLPLATKIAWNDTVHTPWIAPVERWAVNVSLVVYWCLALRSYTRYQRWLDANSGAREEFRLDRVRHFLIAFALIAAVAIGYDLVDDLVTPLNYFDRFWLYLGFALLVYYLGIDGWRHADVAYPVMHEPSAVEAPVREEEPDRADARIASSGSVAVAPAATAGLPVTSPAAAPAVAAARDWAALGATFAQRIDRERWWQEPEITLADLARRLGTNTLYLSRALNDGLGMSFSEFINRRRVDAATVALAGDDDVLDIAMAVGFGSKASFNRAFRAYTGRTPSEFRAAAHAARIKS